MKKQFNAAIYTRLSVDDVRNHARKATLDSFDESMSIKGQKELLSAHVQKMGWNEVRTYADDGWSGSTLDRPAFNEMIDDVRGGLVNLILVTDMSRFGRNYIEVGRYTDFILPSFGCRLVALQDNIDTGSENNEMMYFRSLLNDQYLKDLSNKIKAAHRVMALDGKRVSGRPPYGYRPDPKNKHGFLVDEYSSEVVIRIYEMRLRNMSYAKIAGTLNNDGILSPRVYEYQNEYKGRPYPFKIRSMWGTRSVKAVLTNESYLGHRVQLKHRPISYRLQKVVTAPESDRVRAENTHPGIIEQSVWDAVQAINDGAAKPCAYNDKHSSLFGGLLRCADCGSSLANQTVKHRRVNGEMTAYSRYQCSRYSQTGSMVCSNHSVQEKALKEIILSEIREQAAKTELDKDKILAEIQKRLTKSTAASSAEMKTPKQIQTKVDSVKHKISKLYEDKVQGKISEETFQLLITGYNDERCAAETELTRITEIQAGAEEAAANVETWRNLIDKYSDVTDIDRQLLDDLVDRIEIGKAEYENGNHGKKTQAIKVYYKMLGAVSK